MASPSPLQMISRGVCRRWATALFVGLLVIPGAFGASPRDELLRFVAEDTAICVVFQDMRSHWDALRGSPFAEHFRRSPLGKTLETSPEVKQLLRVKEVLEKQLGIDWDKARDDLFGESVVWAFRPGPPGQSDRDQGLFLLRSRSGETLHSLIDRINEAQKKSGQLKELRAREYKGIKYFCHEEEHETNYYYLSGPILVMSRQEELLKQALDCERNLAGDREPPVTRRLKEMDADRALVALWLNPRAFDTALEARAAKAKPEAEVQKTVVTCWKALDGVALSFHLDRDVSLSLTARARLEQFPPATRKLLVQAGRAGELGRLIPADPLLALTGRLDLAALLDSVGEFLPAKSRQALAAQKEIVKEILPHLGPDLGLVVTAPGPDDKGWTPRSLLAVRVGAGAKGAPFDQEVLAGVRLLAALAVLSHNSQHPDQQIKMKDITLDRLKITCLTGEVFGPDVQPAFALRDGYLVLASSPEAIRRFAPAVVGDSPQPAAIPMVRVSLKAWGAYLKDKDRREGLVKALTADKKMDTETAAEQLKKLQAWLDLFDRIELQQKTSKDQLTLTLSLQPAHPFKK